MRIKLWCILLPCLLSHTLLMTIHGSGMTGFRKHTGSYDHRVVIQGNYLVSPEGTKLGVRHLFTAQISKPYHLPNSKAFNRINDYEITAKKIEPVILVFFAIPRQKITIQFQLSGHVDDLIPEGGTEPSFLGFHLIELDQHMIFWLAYKSRNMDWPSSTHIIYDNGYNVLLIFGQGNKSYRCELRYPKYELNNGVLTITRKVMTLLPLCMHEEETSNLLRRRA